MKERIRILSRLSLITQLGLSFITPPLLLLLGAVWLQGKFGLGDWVLLTAILSGILSGGCSVYNLLRAELARERRGDRKAAQKGENEQ